MLNYKLSHSIIIFTIVNLIFSLWYISDFSGRETPSEYATIAYGFTIGRLTIPFKQKSLLKSIYLGIVFYVIYILSSIVFIISAKNLYNSEYLGLFFSTSFSVILILINVNYFVQLKNRIQLTCIMVLFGFIGALIATYLLNTKEYNLFHSLVTISFLWQMGTGIPLLINLNSNRK